jgi:hypothetical protein
VYSKPRYERFWFKKRWMEMLIRRLAMAADVLMESASVRVLLPPPMIPNESLLMNRLFTGSYYRAR